MKALIYANNDNDGRILNGVIELLPGHLIDKFRLNSVQIWNSKGRDNLREFIKVLSCGYSLIFFVGNVDIHCVRKAVAMGAKVVIFGTFTKKVNGVHFGTTDLNDWKQIVQDIEIVLGTILVSAECG